ncbi:NUDIX hydrolase [marine bacterium AO1-C]|nr:NUDIX hydrolase [marine bacterium AO1-C]
MAHTYDYPRPALTVDCIIFGQSPESEGNRDTKVLLIQRAHEPFVGKWAIPGGFIDANETALQAANRELEEETNLKDIDMKQMHTFTAPGRDPRGWVVSIAYYATVNINECKPIAGDDARNATWFSVDELPEMAFDHSDILKMAIERVLG